MRKSTRATEEFCNFPKQQVLKNTPKGTPPITTSEVNESEENEGEEEGVLCQQGWPVDEGTSCDGSGGYKVELLVLQDRKVRTCCATCIFPCIFCRPCNCSFQ